MLVRTKVILLSQCVCLVYVNTKNIKHLLHVLGTKVCS